MPNNEIPALFELKGTAVFKSDGCSGYISYIWVGLLGRKPLLYDCCRSHDWLYWSATGTRWQADMLIAKCIWAKGYRLLALLFWVGIRIGGSKYLPFAWRWGYGYPHWAYVLWRKCFT